MTASEKEMHGPVPEEQRRRQRKESDIGDKRDVNVVKTCGGGEGGGKHRHIEGVSYDDNIYLPAVIFCISMPTKQRLKTSGALFSRPCTLVHLYSHTMN